MGGSWAPFMRSCYGSGPHRQYFGVDRPYFAAGTTIQGEDGTTKADIKVEGAIVEEVVGAITTSMTTSTHLLEADSMREGTTMAAIGIAMAQALEATLEEATEAAAGSNQEGEEAGETATEEASYLLPCQAIPEEHIKCRRFNAAQILTLIASFFAGRGGGYRGGGGVGGGPPGGGGGGGGGGGRPPQRKPFDQPPDIEFVGALKGHTSTITAMAYDSSTSQVTC